MLRYFLFRIECCALCVPKDGSVRFYNLSSRLSDLDFLLAQHMDCIDINISRHNLRFDINQLVTD